MVEVTAQIEVFINLTVTVVIDLIAALDAFIAWRASILAAILRLSIKIEGSLEAAEELAATERATALRVRVGAALATCAAIREVFIEVKALINFTVTVIISLITALCTVSDAAYSQPSSAARFSRQSPRHSA